MLEGELRLFVDQASGHYQVAGNPLGALVFKCLDLVLRSAVKLLARDILIDFRGTFAVRAVGAAKITRVGYTDRAVFGTVRAKLAGAGISTVEAAGCAVLAVTERFPVSAAEASTFAVTFAAGTITVRLVVTIAVRLALSTTAEGLALSTTEGTTFAVTFAAGTITVRLVVTGTVRLTLTATAKGLTLTTAGERLTLTTTEGTTFAVTFAARTITIRLVVTVTVRFALTATAERLPVSTAAKGLALTATTEGLAVSAAAKGLALTVTFAAGTITEGLVVTIAVRLALTATAERLTVSTAGERLAIPAAAKGLTFTGTRRAFRSLGVTVFPGTESPRLAAGIVIAAERTAVVTAAVAAVVLSHGDSSCYEPTTGAIAAARSVFRYPTQPEIKRFEVRTSQSILGETPPTDDMDPPPGRRRGNVHTPQRTLYPFLQVSGGRSLSLSVLVRGAFRFFLY
nr:hypothetical protein [Pseudarthrobacter psychrotolerans]